MVTVYNLATRETREYFDGLHPFMAVICAHAQFTLKDWNTWMYAKYFLLVDYTPNFYTCGDWCAAH